MALLGRRSAGAALLLVAFALGAVAGYLLGQRRGPVSVQRRVQVMSPTGRLLDGIALDSTQRAQVDRILFEAQPQLDSIMAGITPQLHRHAVRVDSLLRVVLTLAQRRQLDSLVAPRRAPSLPASP